MSLALARHPGEDLIFGDENQPYSVVSVQSIDIKSGLARLNINGVSVSLYTPRENRKNHVYLDERGNPVETVTEVRVGLADLKSNRGAIISIDAPRDILVRRRELIGRAR